MKKSRRIIIFLAVLLFFTLVFVLTSTFKKNPNKLTLDENRWIDSNKYNVIDVSVLNDVPMLSYSGKGLIYTFIDYVSDKYSLKFNIVPYNSASVSNYDYQMKLVNNVSENDLLLMEDQFVLISKEKKVYNDLNSLSNLKLGVLTDDKNDLANYTKDITINYIEYSTREELEQGFNNEEESLDGIITLKKLYMDKLIKNDYTISYEFNNLNRYYVLSSSEKNELSSILSKNYNVWEKEYYQDEYNKEQLNSYFTFKGTSDVQEKNLKNKKYVYGFVNYGVYNHISGNSISGLSGLILENFNDYSGIAIKYTKYNNISKLYEDFISGKVDFALNIFNNAQSNVYNTVSVFDNKMVIVSGNENTNFINNINSLRNNSVLTVKDSYVENYLLNNGVKVKSYNNMDDLLKNYKSQDIVAVDLPNFDYYKSSAFKNSKINYVFELNGGYNYIINNTAENAVFSDLFNFYLNFNSIDEMLSQNYSDVSYKNFDYVYILIIIILGLLAYVVIDFSQHLRVMIKSTKKGKKIKFSKEDKMKYIDQLTSLKNRAYFNSKIDEWDDSEIYPQAIIIVDLNNISYINDNYGREEGDKVITEAANILIQTQLENTEIIRTDGNEFLVYMVGYEEKHVVAYLRKINREFKGLSHGFGAASGYSIINDAIKTLDDAVNEATLDMKNNKEDIEY